MKKTLLTLIVIVQSVLVMAASSDTGSRDDKASANRSAELRKVVKPWVIVAGSGDEMLIQPRFGGPKGKWDAEPETPLHHKDGKPKGIWDSEPDGPRYHRDGKPIKGKWDPEPITPLEK